MNERGKEGTTINNCSHDATDCADILALREESKILGRCWALSEFHISSRSFSNQFLSTVLVCGATPTNWIEGK